MFTVLGAVFPHFCRPLPRAKFHVYRGNVSPLIKSYNTTTGFEHTTYAIKPEHLAHWAMAAVSDIGLKVQYKLAHVRYTPARA